MKKTLFIGGLFFVLVGIIGLRESIPGGIILIGVGLFAVYKYQEDKRTQEKQVENNKEVSTKSGKGKNHGDSRHKE